jgi:hypothetical protein
MNFFKRYSSSSATAHSDILGSFSHFLQHISHKQDILHLLERSFVIRFAFCCYDSHATLRYEAS